MSSFYNDLIALRLISKDIGNPFRSPFTKLPRGSRKPKKPTLALSKEETALMLSLPDRSTIEGIRDYCILALLFGAALRIGELVSVRFQDAIEDYTLTKLNLYNTKNASLEQISLAPWVANSIAEWKKASKREDFEPIVPISQNGVRFLFKRYLKRANIIGRYSPHSARATAITELLRAGHRSWDIQAFSRHASEHTVLKYDRRERRLEDNPGLKLDYFS